MGGPLFINKANCFWMQLIPYDCLTSCIRETNNLMACADRSTNIQKKCQSVKKKNFHSPKTIVRKRGEGVKRWRTNCRWEGRWPLTKLARHWDTHKNTRHEFCQKLYTDNILGSKFYPTNIITLCPFAFQEQCNYH